MARRRRGKGYKNWIDYAVILLFPVIMFGAIIANQIEPKSTADKARPYSIIMIVADDLTVKFVSEYYTGYIYTPNLNLLAYRGLTYRNCFVENDAPLSGLATILTGCYSHEHGIRQSDDKELNPELVTIPTELQKAGFQTALFGKWGFNSTPKGFDKWEILSGEGGYYNPAFIDMAGDTVVERGYVTDVITDKSLRWLDEERDPAKPFFLMINHLAAGGNLIPDLDYLLQYEDETYRLPESFYDDYQGREIARGLRKRIADLNGNGNEDDLSQMDNGQRAVWNRLRDTSMPSREKLNLSGSELTEEKYQRLMRDYAKVVKNLDDNLGRLVKYFYSDVIIIFTSSRGAFAGEHGWIGSGTMYEPSLQVPLIIQGPADYLYFTPEINKYYPADSIIAIGAIETPVQHVDLAPTIFDLAGIAIPDQMKGVSLMPYMRALPPAEPRRMGYFHSYEFSPKDGIYPHYGVRDYRYKLIHFYGEKDVWELYDLYEDPDEMNNIYGKEGMEDITRELMEDMLKQQEKYNDPIRFDRPGKQE